MSPDLHHLGGAFAVDALDLDERTEFERHLAACAACRAEVQELSDAAHRLSSLTEATPSPALRSAVLTGISQIRPLTPLPADDAAEGAVSGEPVPVGGSTEGEDVAARTEGARVIPLFRRPAAWLAAAAAAAVVAVGGSIWAPWSSPDTTVTAIQQVQQAPDVASVTNRKGEVTATLEYSRSLDRSALRVTGLPGAPEGKVYQLWYVGSDEIARSAGFLAAGSDGRAEAVLQGSVSAAAAVGVTVEPVGGSPSPTTDPIVVMAVA